MNKFKSFIANNLYIINTIIISLIISLTVVAVYSKTVTEKKVQKIGTVDIQLIMQGITTAAWKSIESAPVQDVKGLTENVFKMDGLNLERAMETVANNNNIILIQKQAIVNYDIVPDYTDEVVQLMKTYNKNAKKVK